MLRVTLAYADGMVLHTAASGAVPGLDELRLVIERDGALAACGATRVNIAYLTAIPAEDLVAQCLDAVRTIDWQLPWAALTPALDAAHPDLPAPVRMLFEMAAMDGAARAAGRSLTAHLRGTLADDPPAVPTNQTLFRTDDETLERRAQAYVDRGFTNLKLRVGFGPFAEDLARLHRLRRRFGDAVQLSVDANGSWEEDAAPAYLAALAPLSLRYVEQPMPAGDWDALAALSWAAPMPLMLDESLAGLADVARLADTRAAPLGHLKLAKLGGLDRLMQAGRMLRKASVAFMVGQMNEGVVSTLAAAHAARALAADLHELYGADGLAADPAGALRYADGLLHLPPGPGLGLAHHGDAPVLWEATF